MKVRNTGDLKLEALPDAPDAEWLRAFIDDYNGFKRDVTAAFLNLTFGENTKYREKRVPLVHDEEESISVPDDLRGIPIKAVVAMEVEGLTLDSMGRSNGSVYALGLAVPLSWRKDGAADKVIVKAKYDITPSAGVTARVNLLFVGE